MMEKNNIQKKKKMKKKKKKKKGKKRIKIRKIKKKVKRKRKRRKFIYHHMTKMNQIMVIMNIVMMKKINLV